MNSFDVGDIMGEEELNHVKNVSFWLLIGIMIGAGATTFLFSNGIFTLK